jgi:hypothetical protein
VVLVDELTISLGWSQQGKHKSDLVLCRLAQDAEYRADNCHAKDRVNQRTHPALGIDVAIKECEPRCERKHLQREETCLKRIGTDRVSDRDAGHLL